MSSIGKLSLTRKAGEVIWIEDVQVIIGKTERGRTKVIICADKNVRIDRGEIREKREAAKKGGEA